MKTKLIISTILSTFILSGCSNNGNGYGQNNQRAYGSQPPIIQQNNQSIIRSSANSSGNSSIKNSLAYMYDEERLAKDIYLAIYKKQPVKQLSKIASKAEGRHIDAVKTLAQRYGVVTSQQQAGRYKTAHIQSLYNKLYAKGIRSKKDALEVGCMVEVIDVDDLNHYIDEAQRFKAQDVLKTYDFLLKGSYNHYWAFDRGLKQMGISSGCCSLGQKYCHPEYPKKEQGHGGGGARR